MFSVSLELLEMFVDGQLYLYGARTDSKVRDVASFSSTLILKVFGDITRSSDSGKFGNTHLSFALFLLTFKGPGGKGVARRH